MKFRLTVYPDIDNNREKYKQFLFNTREEMTAAGSSVADMLLFLQDDMNVMPDHSNSFYYDKLVDNEWLGIR